MPRLGLVSLIVRDYDEAIAFYTQSLGFTLAEDSDMGEGRRWVVVRPTSGGMGVLLAEAKNADEAARIGNQTGGRVFLFLDTDNFARDHAAMLAKGVKFREPPRREPYGTVAVFEDLYGNLFDLIEPK
jgi:catechol 2,3-dioxygenase-like lactoylglutathione lyase family enzyme